MNTAKIHEIHIDWSGPHTHDEVKKMDADTDFGIYQFYGCHPVYGLDTLLYIGKAQEHPFSSRMCGDYHQIRFGKYWTPADMSLNIGRLVGSSTPSDQEWSNEINLAEKLLIYAHSPAWNSQELNLQITQDHELFNIHVFNWGKYKRLLPEVSGRRYAWDYPEGDEIYSL